MPIVNKPIEQIEQPPYRGKLVDAGGLRRPDDWSRVVIHQQSNGCHLMAHQQDSSNVVVLEVHNTYDKGGEEELENCTMESFELDPDQRLELAVYLLSTINPAKN